MMIAGLLPSAFGFMSFNQPTDNQNITYTFANYDTSDCTGTPSSYGSIGSHPTHKATSSDECESPDYLGVSWTNAFCDMSASPPIFKRTIHYAPNCKGDGYRDLQPADGSCVDWGDGYSTSFLCAPTSSAPPPAPRLPPPQPAPAPPALVPLICEACHNTADPSTGEVTDYTKLVDDCIPAVQGSCLAPEPPEYCNGFAEDTLTMPAQDVLQTDDFATAVPLVDAYRMESCNWPPPVPPVPPVPTLPPPPVEEPTLPLIATGSVEHFEGSATYWAPYVGYQGEITSVHGDVYIFMHEEFTVVEFELGGLDFDCIYGPLVGVSNSCGIHIHAGTSCAEDAGPHFYSVPEDPWSIGTYETFSFPAMGGFDLATGLTAADYVGRTLILHDASGARIACAIIAES